MPAWYDVIGQLQDLYRNKMLGQPAGYAEPTHTPYYYSKMDNPNQTAEYNPYSGNINISQEWADKLRQSNPALLNQIINHEQVHKLLAGPMMDLLPSMTSLKMMQYVWSNPQEFAQMKQELGSLGSPSAIGNIAQEAPAYATEGRYMGNHPNDRLQQYTRRMPDSVKKTYMTLVGGVNQASNQGESK